MSQYLLFFVRKGKRRKILIMKQNRIQNLPEETRPYERCLNLGAPSLSDTELLAVILRTGTKGLSSLALSELVLQLSPYESGLNGLHHVTAEELQQLPGIGKVKAVQILCIAELSRRMAGRSRKTGSVFRRPEEVAEHYMESLCHLERECVICVMLDSRNRLIGDEEISRGTVNASMVSVREVFVTAVTHRAVQIILLHNHPSGDPAPSAEDAQVTGEVSKAGLLLGIPLLDHIIIGSHCFASMKQLAPDLFTEKNGRPYDI